MQRWIRFFPTVILTILCAVSGILAQPVTEVSGVLQSDQTRIFLKDTVYRISGTYKIEGTLVIEPGTRVEFLPNGRIIVWAGGRLIADGEATATYNPNVIDPLDPQYTQFEDGYADLDYFTYPGVITSNPVNEPTVNIDKRDDIFNVNLSTTDSRLQDLTIGEAIIYKASRIEFANSDPNLKVIPWSRPGGKSVNVTANRIVFEGRPVNSFSREWGHIIVLPGARAAYFRSVDFRNFRKDTTVDRLPIYQPPTPGVAAQYEAFNKRLLSMTNGSGGALTTFSSRTWLVNCVFENNMARYRGGAVQFLQAPLDDFGPGGTQAVYPSVDVSNIPYYSTNPFDAVNPNVTDPLTGLPLNQQIRAIDQLMYSSPEPLTDYQRQAVDDGRLALYLGRVRRVTFRNNKVLLANVGQVFDQNGVPIGIEDKMDEAATVDPYHDYKNQAFGGAVYIAGRNLLEVSLGNNNGFDPGQQDYVIFEGNQAINLQPVTPNNTKVTHGAKGGAVYVGNATSVIFAGQFLNNSTSTPFNTNPADYSQGGAIYASANSPRIQIRGGINQTEATLFEGNSSARGGAIYTFLLVPTNPVNLLPSPTIGGSNTNATTRDYGYNIKFVNNEAAFDGGAIYAKKRIRIYGAGGVFGASANYGANYRVEFKGNKAGFSGGAITINTFASLDPEDRSIDIARVIFEDNMVGDTTFLRRYFGNVTASLLAQVRGGGALYTLNGELYSVRATEFLRNKAYNGNGGAICVVSPSTTLNRFFLTDFDVVSGNTYTTGGDAVYTYGGGTVPADVRSLTRFLENEAIPNMDQMGSGTTQPETGDVLRYHPGTNIPENGTGLGGAIYIVDAPQASRSDMFLFDRVRFQDNRAYSGAVVYSDNYDLPIVFNRCLITGNVATSQVGATQNVITGPYVNGQNEASSDLAGAVLYGEIWGPYPSEEYSVLGNVIFDNSGRFLIRLPDAPNTKGVLAGTTGIGYGGVDTLRGNHWGPMGPDVHTIIVDRNAIQETFFIGGDPDQSQLPFVRGGSGKQQGPFESIGKYSYTPIPVTDDPAISIPEKYLQQGVIYDVFDKGTDIKTADYSKWRFARIEDFAVGIPPHLRTYSSDPNDPNYSEYYAGKVVRRWTRDPFVAESDPNIAALQTEFVGDHPIGYPLFLEAWADYSGAAELSNNDERAIHESVFFVINNNTGDYIRVNLRQVDKTSEILRARVEFVPDSGDRYNNPFARRTAEGLANFGSGGTLLDQLYRNARNEDLSVLRGRKYEHNENALGGSGFGYSNRPDLPASTNNGEHVTYFAGEKYSALPVRVGDEVLIVSRTILWREGVNAAIEKGISFRISSSTKPPVWTGNIVELQNLLPEELRNLVMVKEDVSYPRRPGSGPGRDSILTATAVDTNMFYDPRSILFPDQYPKLTYEWEVEPGSGLSYWLQADTLFFNVPTYYGAVSYLRFKGQPTNPFVVPGGEEVVVRVRNWAPSAEIVDSLKALGLSDDEIAKYIYLYRSYMNATVYDSENARFLQQDTVNYAWDHTIEYRFKILVIDSIPIFTAVNARCQTNDTLIASVTDSLRFDVDFNTDDEMEDSVAAARGWDFRYGKTAYGFATTGLRDNPGDTAIDGLSQIRPSWLDPQYLQDENGQPDPFAAAFTDRGILRARLDSSTARAMLRPISQFNSWLVTDTVLSVVVHDGHGGVNVITRPILVNYSPLILTNQVAVAVEDQEYNVQLFDTTRVIRVYDPNFDQRHTFELLYEPTTGILRDPCYPEAGNWDEITSTANTPDWIKIDPETGRLYGIPRVEDAPRIGDNADTITVLVTDEYGLTHVKKIPIEVQMVNHPPALYRDPFVECVDIGEQYSKDITLTDIDLRRTFPTDAVEEITLSVVQPPSGFTVNPSVVQGQGVDTVTVTVTGTVDNNTPRNPDGTVTIQIRAVDKEGEEATLTFYVTVSEQTDFVSQIRVENAAGAYQILEWGTALNATTGKDQDLGGIGKLDSNYCEYEIPPIPPANIFDARWMIPERTGILRNIVPKISDRPLEAGFQSGYGDQSGALYPVKIQWDKATVPSPFPGVDWYMRDANSKGNVFYINMRTGHYRSSAGVDIVDQGGQVTITVFDTKITGFEIVKDSTTAVSVPSAQSGSTLQVVAYPNPMREQSALFLTVPTAGIAKVEVVDILGQTIVQLLDAPVPAGVHRIDWNGMNAAGQRVPAGTYFYKVSVGEHVLVYPITIVK